MSIPANVKGTKIRTLSGSDNHEKLPLGCTPEWAHKESRIYDLCRAIYDYVTWVGYKNNPKGFENLMNIWKIELHQLFKWMLKNKNLRKYPNTQRNFPDA